MRGQSNKKSSPAQTDSAFCLALSSDRAIRIIDRLKTSGFSINNISALFPDPDPAGNLVQAKGIRIHRLVEPSATQKETWQTVRRIGFASMGSITVPGAGPFVAGGRIILVLGAANSSPDGGLAGALAGMGISELEAAGYQSKIAEGRILIVVHAEKPSDVALARSIMGEAGATCVSNTDVAALEIETAAPPAPIQTEFASVPSEPTPESIPS